MLCGLCKPLKPLIKKALDLIQQSLVILRDIGDEEGVGNQLGNLGEVSARMGRPDQAYELFMASLKIFEEIESPNANIIRNNLEELIAQK